jgi:hypothetical protein
MRVDEDANIIALAKVIQECDDDDDILSNGENGENGENGKNGKNDENVQGEEENTDQLKMDKVVK